jgi:hypothetical protein
MATESSLPEYESPPNFTGVTNPNYKRQPLKKNTFRHVRAALVIKFLVKEQNDPKEIHRRLKAISGGGAMKRA